MDRIDSNIQHYRDWLEKQPNILKDENTGWNVIPTDTLGLFNDNLEFYFKEEGGNVVLSDNGDIIANFLMSGVDTASEAFHQAFGVVESRWGVKVNESGEMTKLIKVAEFGQGKQDFLSAMVYVFNAGSRSESSRETKFIDDVAALMRNKNVNALSDVSVYGESGFCFSFDYMLARPDEDYVIQPFIHVDIPNLSQFVFGIEDVKNLRERVYGRQVRGMVILNDVEGKIDERILKAINAHKLEYVLWSRHDESEVLSRIVA